MSRSTTRTSASVSDEVGSSSSRIRGIEAHRLDDLHHLLEVVGQIADHGVGVDVDLVLIEQAADRLAHRPCAG